LAICQRPAVQAAIENLFRLLLLCRQNLLVILREHFLRAFETPPARDGSGKIHVPPTGMTRRLLELVKFREKRFCNGPGFVKSSLHSRVIHSAGVALLSGVGALAAT
jgi:hypothetical protein